MKVEQHHVASHIPNILIVDDIGDNLRLLDDILKPEGYKTRLVPGGELALKAAEIEKPDLILLDIMMPGMDGFEVCRRLKANPGLADVPVIFISALGDTPNIVKALTTGGVDYINKPFQAEEVIARAQTHLKLHNQSLELLEQKEKLKRQTKELEKLNATKDKFFSIIAHDLKSPFHAIMGFSEILVEQVREKDYDGIEKHAEIILKSSQKSVDLLMNLMEWVRAKTGRMEFIPEHFEMVDFIKKITSLFDDIAGQKSIAIKKDLPLNATVYADQAMINTVFRNLISNAIKFTNPGGEITISAVEKPDVLTVTVRDSGVGISKDRIEKLFRLDETYSTPGTNNEKGTGLGLILCKEFVEKHGGNIWVESSPCEGSMFIFTIPNA
ncbi:MAG: hybrid sensor histidine kinase/response regulator [Bacteroidetes bacterium]|nr:hybrid sensor histidine kinase/response regulator [Bacteroidota bacterium]